MRKGWITFIIQPDWNVPRKYLPSVGSVSFPRRCVHYFSLCVLLLIGFGVLGSWNIIDNRALKKNIKYVRASLHDYEILEDKISNIRSEEKIIREFLGIEALDKNFDINDRMGKGGMDVEEDFELTSLDAEEEIIDIVEEQPLHLSVQDLRADIHELAEVLSKMRETLNCRPTVMPVKDDDIWITSGFGWRKSPFTGLREFHKGLDISGRKGAPIISTADGKVKKVGYNRFIGRYVIIDHDERFSTKYGHLLKYCVKKNQDVKRGDVIGYMGTSGMSTGYHLHYEVADNSKKVNPYNFVLNRGEHSLSDVR